MTLYLQLKSGMSGSALWLTEHPGVVRAAMLILPFVVALAFALFAHTAAYAARYPVCSGQCGGGG